MRSQSCKGGFWWTDRYQVMLSWLLKFKQGNQDHHRGHMNRSPLGQASSILSVYHGGKKLNIPVLQSVSNRQELWALKMNVIPLLMTYQTTEFTQNPILGYGAQLSKVLNLSVKTEDTFKRGRMYFLPSIPRIAEILVRMVTTVCGLMARRIIGAITKKMSQKTSWNASIKMVFLNQLVGVLYSSVLPCQSVCSSSGVSSEGYL